MKKILLTILLAGLCSMVFAQIEIMDNTDNLTKEIWELGTHTNGEIAIIFTTNATPYNLHSVTLVLYSWAPATSDVTFSIQQAYGDNIPTGPVLASETFSNQTIPVVETYTTFTFSSLNSYAFSANTKYALVISTSEKISMYQIDGIVLPTSSYYTVHHTIQYASGWFPFNSFAIRIMGTEGALPVELSSFSAKSESRSVVLDWLTESESDNLGFILERSDDNNSWQTIASHQTHPALQGQGNTSDRTDYSFTDKMVEPDKTYYYRLSDISTKGETSALSSVSVKTDKLPETTEMKNAYPNPFNPQTKIAYNLAIDTNVNISVFDLLGRQVKSLFNGNQTAGSHHVYWNATNETGSNVPSGCYLIRMQAGNTTQMQKVILMK